MQPTHFDLRRNPTKRDAWKRHRGSRRNSRRRREAHLPDEALDFFEGMSRTAQQRKHSVVVQPNNCLNRRESPQTQEQSVASQSRPKRALQPSAVSHLHFEESAFFDTNRRSAALQHEAVQRPSGFPETEVSFVRRQPLKRKEAPPFFLRCSLRVSLSFRERIQLAAGRLKQLRGKHFLDEGLAGGSAGRNAKKTGAAFSVGSPKKADASSAQKPRFFHLDLQLGKGFQRSAQAKGLLRQSLSVEERNESPDGRRAGRGVGDTGDCAL